jgi:hydroxylamine reductase (hybrid-cluster protein)
VKEILMEKQQKIVEMAKDICRVKHICNDVCKPISACDALKYAERAVEARYCKREDLVKEIADFIYDGEIEGLNIEMNGRYLGKNDFIKEFTTPKAKGGTE